MKIDSDVVVVGGGPCGSFTALNLAKRDVDVTVFEEHSEIGAPSHCAGHLSIKGLRNLGLYPLPERIVENTFYGVNFYSPRAEKFSVRFHQPITCVVNRVLFDKHIAHMAQEAGVDYCLNSSVESLTVENDFVRGVVVKRGGEGDKSFLTKIVVDAEGVSSRIFRLTSLRALDHRMLFNAVQAEVENVKNVEPNIVEVFLGEYYAPGFYAWLIPKSDGNAKVGLAAKAGNPKVLLQKLMLKHPVASEKLRAARILQTSVHPLTLGGPIPKAYSNGFLAVGDVASQVKPTTGGGVIFGMTCARVAAEVAYEALERNDFSSGFLALYQKRCEEVLGFDAKVMLRIRRMLGSMSDEKLNEGIGLCAKLGLGKAVQNFKDIDFQGQALLRALRDPRVLTALIYFFFLYLSANP